MSIMETVTSNRSRISAYRGFRLRKRTNGSFRVEWTVKGINYYLPRVFNFRGNIHMLHKYIDALVERDLLVVERIENTGVVDDVEWDDSGTDELAQRKMIHISPERLLEILLLRDPLEIPADTAIRFVPKDGQWWPEVVVAGLLDKSLLRDEDLPNKSEINIPASQIPTQYATTGLNNQIDAEGLDGNFEPTGQVQNERPPAPTHQHTVKVVNHDHYHEVLDLIQDQRGTYYRRQLVRNGRAFYTATAWSISGPWHRWWQDERMMLAMGVHDEPA